MRLYANPHTYRARPCSKPAAEARAVSAVADGVGCGLCASAARGRGRGREAAEPPTHSIADGTALRCGRVGSRHFQSL